MNILAVGLVVLSALMHASRDFFTKKSGDKQVFVWWYELFSIIIYLPVFLYLVAATGMPSHTALLISAGAGIVHFFYWVFLSKALQHGDLSHVYPIMRSAPAIVLILSVVLLQEKVTPMGVVGILLMVFGVYLLNLKKITLAELWAPIASIGAEKATKFAVLTMLTVSAYSIIDKVAVSYVNPLQYIFLINIFAFALYTPYILREKSRALIANEFKENKKTAVLNGFFVIFGYALILVAFTLDNVSYITGLRQLSAVFAVILGGHLLLEKNRSVRLTAAVIGLIGALLISIS